MLTVLSPSFSTQKIDPFEPQIGQSDWSFAWQRSQVGILLRRCQLDVKKRRKTHVSADVL